LAAPLPLVVVGAGDPAGLSSEPAEPSSPQDSGRRTTSVCASHPLAPLVEPLHRAVARTSRRHFLRAAARGGSDRGGEPAGAGALVRVDLVLIPQGQPDVVPPVHQPGPVNSSRGNSVSMPAAKASSVPARCRCDQHGRARPGPASSRSRPVSASTCTGTTPSLGAVVRKMSLNLGDPRPRTVVLQGHTACSLESRCRSWGRPPGCWRGELLA